MKNQNKEQTLYEKYDKVFRTVFGKEGHSLNEEELAEGMILGLRGELSKTRPVLKEESTSILITEEPVQGMLLSDIDLPEEEKLFLIDRVEETFIDNRSSIFIDFLEREYPMVAYSTSVVSELGKYKSSEKEIAGWYLTKKGSVLYEVEQMASNREYYRAVISHSLRHYPEASLVLHVRDIETAIVELTKLLLEKSWSMVEIRNFLVDQVYVIYRKDQRDVRSYLIKACREFGIEEEFVGGSLYLNSFKYGRVREYQETLKTFRELKTKETVSGEEKKNIKQTLIQWIQEREKLYLVPYGIYVGVLSNNLNDRKRMYQILEARYEKLKEQPNTFQCPLYFFFLEDSYEEFPLFQKINRDLTIKEKLKVFLLGKDNSLKRDLMYPAMDYILCENRLDIDLWERRNDYPMEEKGMDSDLVFPKLLRGKFTQKTIQFSKEELNKQYEELFEEDNHVGL